MPIRPSRACTTRKWPLIPTRNSTVARNTVSRMYLSAASPASVPLANASSAVASAALDAVASGITYWGMYEGPGGELGLWAGSVASHALNAGRYPGRSRLTASASAFLLPTENALNQALNDTESKVRVTIASLSKRVARVRWADALGS